MIINYFLTIEIEKIIRDDGIYLHEENFISGERVFNTYTAPH